MFPRFPWLFSIKLNESCSRMFGLYPRLTYNDVTQCYSCSLVTLRKTNIFLLCRPSLVSPRASNWSFSRVRLVFVYANLRGLHQRASAIHDFFPFHLHQWWNMWPHFIFYWCKLREKIFPSCAMNWWFCEFFAALPLFFESDGVTKYLEGFSLFRTKLHCWIFSMYVFIQARILWI